MILAIDTETTGLDFAHSARPFFVSTCDEEGEQRYWEWSVNPRTRMPLVPSDDLDEIEELVRAADVVVGHNVKFDVRALGTLRASFLDWPWDKTDDTMLMSHLLHSNQPKSLTDLTIRWLGHDLSGLEDELERAVKAGRTLCRRKDFVEKRGQWLVAKEGVKGMPSAKGECWRYDYWLPRALDRSSEALRNYALADTAATIALRKVLLREVEGRGLARIYRHRVEQLAVACRMEVEGVTVNLKNFDELRPVYREKSERLKAELEGIARKYNVELTLPKNGVNASLRRIMFDVFKVPPVFSPKSKTGEPTLDKSAMALYQATLPEGDALAFVAALAQKRKVDTSLSYMESYETFFVPVSPGYARIHPSINIVGTDTLRTTSQNPNEQQISKQVDAEGHSLRYAFGPGPGREWWSMDYENIELRIPAYLAQEEELIQLFERPDDPPYYGSNHLFAAHVLWPSEFEECLRTGEQFKKKYKDTLYQWTKNGNFAVQYGAMEESGTADRAYHQRGAQRKIKDRLRRIAALNEETIRSANRLGYVETIPDRDVEPGRGYPLMCSRTGFGEVRPTVPLNYLVQGTAMQCTMKATVRCQRLLDGWNAASAGRWRGFIAMQVHDEIVFDLPALGKKNLPKVNALRRAMEMSGVDIGIPLKVSVSFHPNNWAEEGKLC